MKVHLRVVGWRDFRPWKAAPGNVQGSLAWSSGGVVYVRAGMQWCLWGLARVAHELEHVRDTSFGNPEHHPWSHFCLRSYFPVRFWRHGKTTRAEAAELRNHGEVTLAQE